MKINKISIQNSYYYKNSPKFKKSLGVSSFEKKIIKSNPDGTQTILNRLDFSNPNNIEAGYLKIVGDNNNLIKDMRFDTRYNEINAIEYEDNFGKFAHIKNGLTISFDVDGQIRNIYLIRKNKEKEKSTHCVLNIFHGLSITSFDKDNNKIPLSNSERKEQIEHFISHTNNMIKLAQSNNLKGSNGLSHKFLYFIKNTL